MASFLHGPSLVFHKFIPKIEVLDQGHQTKQHSPAAETAGDFRGEGLKERKNFVIEQK